MSSDGSVNNYPTPEIIILSDDDDMQEVDDTNSYFQNISLRYFVDEPLEMKTQHEDFKDLCMMNGNPEAHYIEGILQYFEHENKVTGMYHLRVSARLNYSNGIYLYGLLMLARGHYPTGKKYLDKLNWQLSFYTTELCWESIKNSLSSISVELKRRYYVNMVNLQPTSFHLCHDSLAEVCEICYYYKRLRQFYVFVSNKA